MLPLKSIFSFTGAWGLRVVVILLPVAITKTTWNCSDWWLINWLLALPHALQPIQMKISYFGCHTFWIHIAKVLNPKYHKLWLYALASTIDCGSLASIDHDCCKRSQKTCSKGRQVWHSWLMMHTVQTVWVINYFISQKVFLMIWVSGPLLKRAPNLNIVQYLTECNYKRL